MQIEDGGTSKDDACFYDYLVLVDGAGKGSSDKIVVKWTDSPLSPG